MQFTLALLPVIALVALGRFLAGRQWVPEDGWRGLDRLCYMLLFPALVANVLSDAPIEQAPVGMAIALIGAQLVLASTGLITLKLSSFDGPATGSVIQSNARWNTMVALSIGASMFGAEGIALVAIASACMIPTANLISVTALTSFGDSPNGAKRNPLAELLRNPIVIACIVGGLLNLTNAPIDGPIRDTMDLLGRAAVPLGLLSAGAGLDLKALRRAGARTGFWSFTRLLGMPLLAFGIARALGLSDLHLAIVVICASTPTATNGYILAKELGGDATLMANLIAVQTVLAAMTMPLMFFILTNI